MSTIALLYDLPHILDRLMDQEECRGVICAGERLSHGPFPPVQIIENERSMQVRALLPGIPRSSISLELLNGTLVIDGELPAATGRYHRHERPSGRFHRVIDLPCPVAEGQVQAILRNGLLTVTMPKGAPCLRRSINVCGLSEDGS